MRHVIPGLVALAVFARVETAEACACCDAKFTRAPVGWTAEGALVVDTSDTIACEVKKRLELWTLDAPSPSACFDLFGDPETPVACDSIVGAAPQMKAKTSS
jgi:hypothetical protein